MKQNVKVISTIIVLTIILMACNSAITFPPVSQTPTNSHNQGQFVWHDLATYDPLAAKDFYSEVFDWEFETLGTGSNVYYVVKNKGIPIGGMFKLADKYGKAAEWIASISVPDVDAAISYNTSGGGKTIFKKAAFDGRGETALVQDPQGAFVAFLHSESGDPQPQRAGNIKMNSWLWNELWTNDLDASLGFYRGLTSSETEEVKAAKVPYFMFKQDNNTFSGAIGNPVEGARSAWMPYIKVKDVNATFEKAKAAGAHVMMEPTQSIRKGTVAVLMDPTGAQFTIQQWILR
ncbi:VOC family protein [uncultured Draconibacterium sp.]|uniref:VOC family protein n=1 Tax=uncultured Draconibacterium sp. TaxID=1573823 RepID=UPI0029C66E03|nr:VOC family protein [uncultured Draconibacterium sp.]